ncbi:nicotinamide riboside transporter PnuC [Oceaniserpentilla sp. 4NH20-0058]|uniref:nicotinamide riboside transporter PnuC n=1 Tax=Oceaniserpentilla sp. 4NH20-0058 TaxID=3127660 RepID=UPI0031046564
MEADTQTQQSFNEAFIQGVISAAQAMSYWEVIAVALGIAYLVLAMRENSLCWYAAFGSTAIYSWLFFDVSLIMESALNVYYLVMAIYGWYVWNKKPQHSAMQNDISTKLPITVWSGKQHTLAIGAVLLLTFTSGFLLHEHTTAVMPYLDSFTTWGAVLTTYMVAKKVLENWIYWLVIDSLAIYLYLDRELYLTALLMAVYVVMVVFGFNAWLKTYKNEQSTANKQYA